MNHETERSDFHVQAKTTLADARLRALKDGELFGIFDRRGDIRAFASSAQGVYYGNTRFLSRLELRVDGAPPLLLSSTVREDSPVLLVDLTNPDIDGRSDAMPADAVHIQRSRFLCGARSWERLALRSHALGPVTLTLSFHVAADYRDIFEVRGLPRPARGEMLPARVSDDGILLGYRGLDDVIRETEVTTRPRPSRVTSDRIEHVLELAPGEEAALELAIECRESASPSHRLAGSEPDAQNAALRDVEERARSSRARACHVSTSNELFNAWLDRSSEDLHILTTETEHGLYPYAGIPWFSTAFGRDGIVSALQRLWADPALAEGVLRFLAAHQATDFDDAADAEPGKLLHERRRGEMASLGEVPFGRYYGSVDATPLFVYLAGQHYLRVRDRALLESLWPSITAALRWIEELGDRDGDGLVDYGRRSASGLVHQGWKDSNDCIFHDDGDDADPPIALCEVQAYVFGAHRMAAVLADALGEPAEAQRQRDRAERLRAKFEETFWLEAEGTYALAVDGSGRVARVRSSNAGQCLLTGIASKERADRVVDTMMAPELFSGWGIRTLATDQPRYNPLSYHNGSVWPHDNALVALGMSRYGHSGAASRVLEALFDAATHFELHRLPELFCGIPRRPGSGPVVYPVACEPQAWAAGSVYMLLQATLGLTVDALAQEVIFREPRLPKSLRWVELRALRCGDAEVDLRVERHGGAVAIKVLRKHGTVRVTSLQ